MMMMAEPDVICFTQDLRSINQPTRTHRVNASSRKNDSRGSCCVLLKYIRSINQPSRTQSQYLVQEDDGRGGLSSTAEQIPHKRLSFSNEHAERLCVCCVYNRCFHCKDEATLLLQQTCWTPVCVCCVFNRCIHCKDKATLLLQQTCWTPVCGLRVQQVYSLQG